jgi:phosphoglycerate dehydrogenase-like enzyme
LPALHPFAGRASTARFDYPMDKYKAVVQWSDLMIWLERIHLEASQAALVRAASLAGQVQLVMALDADSLRREIIDADFLITENRPIGAELLDRAKRLRLIQNGRLRHDEIDIAAARRAGIPVSAVALPCDIAVAEHAILLMMALGKKLTLADRAARRGEARHTTLVREEMTCDLWSLNGKVLGIVGLGEIGAMVAQRCRAFGMRVIYSSARRRPPAEEPALGVEFRTLPALMAEADIISVHLPDTPATTGLIGRREIAAMKPHAVLVNTSRGSLLDEQALIEALAAKRIGGAGLDVFRTEPLPLDHPLSRLDNVVLTPHLGGAGSVLSSIEALFSDIARVIRGEPVRHLVN